MSTHFWMMAGVTAAASAVMGLGLGGYVVSPPRSALIADSATEFVEAGQAELASTGNIMMQDGPAVIRCTGCGPTLADRRWHADMAAIDTQDGGMSDHEASDAAVDPLYGALNAPPRTTVVQDASTGDAEVAAPVMVVRTVQEASAPPPVLVGTDSSAGVP